MKRDCNEWNRAGKPQGPRRDVVNIVIANNQPQHNNNGSTRQHRNASWLVRNGHDDVCLLNMDICLTMIEEGEIKEVNKEEEPTFIDEQGIEWDIESKSSSNVNMEGIEEIQIEGLDEMSLTYESSSTGMTYVNQSVTAEGLMRYIESWELTVDIAMSAVTGNENKSVKISDSIEAIHELYGSEEENNKISEKPSIMIMNYEVEATQFIRPPEVRRNGRDSHPSMLRLNWDYGIHLPEK
jgi:hypothetical protein